MSFSPPQGYVASSVLTSKLWFNVLDYGADPLGLIDSTTIIQNAITAAQVKGGLVFFPTGNYLLSSALSITKPVALEGPIGSFFGNANYGARLFTNTNGIHMIDIALSGGVGGNEESGGMIHHLQLDGNNKSNIGVNVTGPNTVRLEFNRMHVRNCTHLGLYTSANHSLQFYNSSFTVNGPLAGAAATDGGVQIDGTNAVHFYGCNVEANHGSGLLFTAGFTNGFHGGVIEGNDFHGVIVSGGSNPQHITIENVDFELNNASLSANIYDVDLESTSAYCTLRDLKMSGNNVTNSIKNAGTLNTLINCRSAGTPKISWTATSGVYIGASDDLTSSALPAGVTRVFGRTVAGTGIPVIFGVTKQTTEISSADPTLLTYTPPASAGVYRIHFSMAVSAAVAATLGWTATWKDSNGTAQAPTNLDLIKNGVAAPALTFLAAAGDTYVGDTMIDVDNSATAIVCKLTFTGTSFTARVSAIIEQVA